MIVNPSRLLTVGTRKGCYSACCADPLGWDGGHIYHRRIECAGHLSTGLDPIRRREITAIIIKILERHTFDAIAFRGLSGALFAPAVAMAMDKTLLCVRKGERNHSSRMVEGDYGARKYVMLDDMVSSGDTVRAMHAAISEVMPYAECIGLLQYLWLSWGSVGSARSQVCSIEAYVNGQQSSPWSAL